MWEDVVDSFNLDVEYRINWNLLNKIRLEKLWDLMGKKGLDAVLLTIAYNIRYVTNFRPLFGPFYVYDRYAALVPRKEEPILYMTEPEVALGAVKKRMPWIKECRKLYQFSSSLYAIKQWANDMKDALKEHGIERGTIGIDYLSFMAYEHLRRELGMFEIVPFFDDVTKLRMEKAPEELKVMAEAIHIVEAGMRVAIESIKEGVKEYEVGAEALKVMASMGMEVATHSPSVRSGENAAIFQRTTTGKRLRNGETVIIDIGAMWGGYCADFCRTTVVGRPNVKQREMFTALLSAHLSAINSIKPGMKVSELDKKVRNGIVQSGFPNFPGGTGHGIGVCLGELPLIPPPSEELDFKLMPGMVICLEPGIFVPGVAGVKVEDMVLITDDGAKILTKSEYDEKLLS